MLNYSLPVRNSKKVSQSKEGKSNRKKFYNMQKAPSIFDYLNDAPFDTLKKKQRIKIPYFSFVLKLSYTKKLNRKQ